MRSECQIARVGARAYVIPTDQPEADGTFAWASTTLVVCEVEAAGRVGLGLTYAERGNAALISGMLAEIVVGRDAMDVTAITRAMQAAVRNIGRGGLAATAISAVDLATWDLKAKLLDLPLVVLLGQVRDEVPIYGSGGFTSYLDEALSAQLGGWVAHDGCAFVKMKIGAEPERDVARMRVARDAIGDAALFIDANGAFTPGQAIAMAQCASELDVSWLEEPVSSDDLAGLAFVRDHAPGGMDIAAGEYVYTPDDARRMLSSGAVDVQQADATRCGGVTGFMTVATLCNAFHTPLSGHCAPAMHLHVAAAAPGLRHLEWFHDHVRIEAMLLDGAPVSVRGAIRPDLSRPGHGLVFKQQDAERYAV